MTVTSSSPLQFSAFPDPSNEKKTESYNHPPAHPRLGVKEEKKKNAAHVWNLSIKYCYNWFKVL